MSPIPARESRPSIERIGRFIPRHFVGAGGFGKVWEVDDPLRPGSSLALKVLDARSDDADRPTPVTEIAREFQAGIRIRHPVLVEPIEVGVLESRGPYLLSEFVSGSPLVPFWSSDALEPVALQILEALHAIHQAGWRHGDIQPHNILVTQTDDKIDSAGGAGNIDVRLLDLGLARKINGKTGHVGDSPRYLAPEVLKGETPDHRADLYALGLVLFECLAGPVKKKIADHLLDTRLGKLHETVRNARLPGRLGKLITSLLDPDPRQRIQSARESIEVLSGSNAMTSLTPAFESVASLGQDSYFEVLETSLDWMTRGKSHFSLIAVEGATGLGKTRLCRETAAVAMSHGVRCITWRSLSSPPGPDETNERDPNHYFGSEAAAGSALTVPQDRHTGIVFDRLVATPTVIVVDDLGALDAEQTAIFESLIERLLYLRDQVVRQSDGAHVPCLVLTASPPELERPDLSRLWQRCCTLPWASRHELTTWTDSIVSGFLDQVLPPRRELGGAERWLVQEGAGNPIRLRRLLQTLHQSGKLRLDEGCWTADNTDLPTLLATPGERGDFRQEWQRLDATCQTILGLCSVHDLERLSLDVLVNAGDSTRTETLRALRKLQTSEALSTADAAASTARDMGPTLDRRKRAWILRLLGRTRRQDLRARLASTTVSEASRVLHRIAVASVSVNEILDPRAGIATERLLRSFSWSARAKSEDRARAACRLAEMLLVRGENRGARRQLERALELAPDQSDSSFTRARLTLGEIHLAAGDLASARRLFDKVREHLDVADDDYPRLLFHEGVHRHRGDDVDDSLVFVSDAVKRFPEDSRLRTLCGNVHMRRSEFAEAEESFRHARRLATRHRRHGESAVAAVNYALLFLRRRDLKRAVDLFKKASRKSSLAGNRSVVAPVQANLGLTLRRLGEYELAFQALQESLRIYRELGDLAGMAIAESNLGILARELGLPGTATRRFTAALALARRAGHGSLERLESARAFIENRVLLALDLGDMDVVRELESRLPSGDDASIDASAESLLARAILFDVDDEASGKFLSRVLAERRLDEPKIIWLAELARRTTDANTHPLVDGARQAVKTLATRSARCKFYSTRMSFLVTSSPEDFRRLGKTLPGLAKRHAPRAARIACLSALAKHHPDDDAREKARLLLIQVSMRFSRTSTTMTALAFVN